MNRACCRLAALFLVGLAVFAPISAGDGSTVMVQNEAIRLVVNDTDDGRGRFAVDVTGGDPARVEDNGQPLIYGRPIPWTSYTTVRIDGVSYAFGGPTTRRAGKDLPTGEAATLPAVKDGAIISAWRYGEIEVTQHLSIVEGPTTGALDTARIAYTITNRGQEKHRVGLRICLDTMLGENDGAPLRMGARQIETDEALSGAQIQPYWQAFDSLSEPKVIAQGTLAGGELTPPHRMFFTNWGNLADAPWEPKLVAGRDFTREGEFELDSAVALLWDETELAPGGVLTRVTYYGLGGLTITNGVLTLGLTAPANVNAGDTFMVLGYLENRGTGMARDAVLTLEPSAGLQASSSRRVSLGGLKPGETRQVAWMVKATGAGAATIKLTATAFQLDTATVQRKVLIVAPPKLSLSLSEPPAIKVVGGRLEPYPAVVKAVIGNIGGFTAQSARAQIAPGPGLNLAPGENGFRWFGSLQPGEKVTVQWSVVMSGTEGSGSYTVLAMSNECQPVSGKKTIKWPNLPRQLKVITTPVPGRKGWHRIYVSLANLPDLARLSVRLQLGKVRLVAVERGGFLVAGDKVLPWAVQPVLQNGAVLLSAERPSAFADVDGSFASLWVEGVPRVTAEIVQALDEAGRPIPVSIIVEEKGGA